MSGAQPEPISPLLHGVSVDAQAELLAGCTQLTLQDGELLIDVGQDNHHLYILTRGRMAALLTGDSAQPGFPIVPGELIGDMSIIDGQPVSARVISVGESQLVAIHEDYFWERMAPYPGVARNLLRLMSKRMRDRNQVMIRAIEQDLQLAHLHRELASAAAIQMGLLPNQRPFFPRFPELDIHAVLKPAKVVGGDLYETMQVENDQILVAVGDVSGKGMPAALYMMRTLTLLRAQAGGGLQPEELLPVLNRLLCESNEADMFVTLYIAILSLRTGRLRLLNGGHNPPLLSRQGAAFEVLNQAKGALLGVMPNAQYTMAEIFLSPGDRLILYSDGITEAENTQQQWFSLERMRLFLDQIDSALDMKQSVDALADEVNRFAEGAMQSDDITILGLRMPELLQFHSGTAPG